MHFFFNRLLINVSILLLSSSMGLAASEAKETVRLGIALQPLVTLAIIAHERGFFSQEGLDVPVQYYPSGKAALEAMFAGEVEIATVAETPIVFSSFKRNDFRIFTTIGTSRDEQRIIARKDRGVNKPADLKGKRLATQQGSAVHFFLHLFLLQHGMSENDITLSFKKVEELPEALASGEIDGFALREPFIAEAKKLLGEKAIVFEAPGLYAMTFHLVAANEYIRGNPELLKKMLRALLGAERFVKERPGEAQKIVAARLKITDREMTERWPDIGMRVSLDQSLLLGLEDEARWMIQLGLTDKKETPNFLNFLYLDGLDAIKPMAITVIR